MGVRSRVYVMSGYIYHYQVYHRYLQYRLLLGGLGWNSYYYNHYYYNNQCWGGCPFAAHCEWGFCECNRGYQRSFGGCVRDLDSARQRPDNFNPFVDCREGSTCQRIGKAQVTFWEISQLSPLSRHEPDLQHQPDDLWRRTM